MPQARSRLRALTLLIALAGAAMRAGAQGVPTELSDKLVESTVYIESQIVLSASDWDALPAKARQAVGKRPQGVDSGSGVLISSDGLILTNAHVIDDIEETIPLPTGQKMKWHYLATSHKVVVRAGLKNEKTYTPRILKVNKEADLALLKISDDAPFAALALAPPTPLTTGRPVVMAGFPGGKLTDQAPFSRAGAKVDLIVERSPKVSINAGTISALRQRDREFYYQLDISANPGNSGGPIVTPEGQIVALLSAGIPSLQSIAFAIPEQNFSCVLPSTLRADADTTATTSGPQSYEAFKASGKFKLAR